MRRPSVSGLVTVLVLHGLVLYGLWQTRSLTPPAETKPVFVHLIDRQPKTETMKTEPPTPTQATSRKPSEPPPPPAQLLGQSPIETPREPTASPPPAVPPRVELAATAPQSPAEPPAPPKPAGPILLGGELSLACLERRPPAYPAASRRLGEEGRVVVRVELSEDGRVDQAVIQSSSGIPRLDDAALSAVRQWRCRPAERDGQAVRAVALQPFDFVLEGR